METSSRIARSLATVVVLTVVALVGWRVLRQRALNEDGLAKSNDIRGAETCESISPNAYNTFLIFNPGNYQTYFFRSECFQKVAARTRDRQLCTQVVERESWFLDGSAISPAACLAAVAAQVLADQEHAVDPAAIHRLERVEVARTVAGDFDVQAFPVGRLWGTYEFTVSVMDGAGRVLAEVERMEVHLTERRDPLQVLIYRTKLRQLAGGALREGDTLTVHLGLRLLRDDAGQVASSGLSAAELESSASTSITF
jgi:hypothetical protein